MPSVNDNDLLERIRARAANPSLRVDARSKPSRMNPSTPLRQCATATALAAAEAKLGARLPSFYVRLVSEVADGGFGPGGGLFGIGSDAEALHGLGGALAVRRDLGGERGRIPPLAVPLVDFGSDGWVLLDASSERGTLLLLRLEDDELYETELELRGWLQAWVNGASALDSFYDKSKAVRRKGWNPFIKNQWLEFTGRGPLKGKLIRRDADGQPKPGAGSCHHNRRSSTATPVSSLDELWAKMETSEVIRPGEIEGCTDEELREIEQRYSVVLPSSYRAFLARMGRRSGRLFRCDHFAAAYPHPLLLTESVLASAEGEGPMSRAAAARALGSDGLVVLGRLGEVFLFLRCGEGDNPPVHHLDSSSWETTAAYPSVLAWLDALCNECIAAIETGYFDKHPKGTSP